MNANSGWKVLLYFLAGICSSCGESILQEARQKVPTPVPTLGDYVVEVQSKITHTQPLSIKEDIIACAAGGQEKFATNDLFPVSILFYPMDGATDIRYFETSQPSDTHDDFEKYIEKKLQVVPILGGHVMRILHPEVPHEVWGRVTLKTKGMLHVSGGIRIKLTTKPSQYAPELLEIQANKLNPNFTWQDGRLKENAIYFQVIHDKDNDLISGTYTLDKRFNFYDLSNVEINIRDINPPPTLQENEEYTFLVMGISKDNWVNFIANKKFKYSREQGFLVKPGGL